MEVHGEFLEHLYVHKWEVQQPLGTVLVSHGMAEHGKRYAHFAAFLNSHNWNVWAVDHRGHGKTAEKSGKFGYLAGQDGWDKVAEDLKMTAEKIKETFPELPIILLGHSAGSILAAYSVLFKKMPVQGLIASALAPHPGLLLPIGHSVAKLMCAFQGKDKPGKVMNALTFGDFNKPFKPNRTDFDWLSTDEAQVDKYVADPWCGFVCCNGFFADMLGGLRKVHSNLNNLPSGLPVLMLAGADDPVVSQRKGFEKNIASFKKTDARIQSEVYEGFRHEILNEQQRERVYQDIWSWIQNRIDL